MGDASEPHRGGDGPLSSMGAPSLPAQELDALIWSEIQGPARLIARYRFVAVAVISLVVVPLLALEPRTWALTLYVGVTLVLGAVLVRDAIYLKDAPISARSIPYFVGTIVLFHTVLIVATGGAESPFIFLYAIIGLVPAMSIGRPRPAFSVMALPLTLLWLLTIGSLAGWLPDLRPVILGGEGDRYTPLFLLTQALVLTIACIIGSTVILALRAAIERTARTAVTMRHEAMLAMRERNEELVHLSGELAHELKNPLASIRGLSALVERKLPEGSKEKEQMGVLVGEVKRMAGILDEFLNFSRPAVGLSARSVRPREIAAEVVALYEGLARQRGVELRIEGGDEGSVRCDPRKVKQVIVNLVQNAVDAMPDGGRITLSVRPGPGEASTILVEDTGPGLAEEVRGRLFQVGVTTKTAGSGLGLTIARAIAEQHGGSLDLRERSEGGCRATLVLPHEPPAREPAAERMGGAPDHGSEARPPETSLGEPSAGHPAAPRRTEAGTPARTEPRARHRGDD